MVKQHFTSFTKLWCQFPEKVLLHFQNVLSVNQLNFLSYAVVAMGRERDSTPMGHSTKNN